ncbi:DUF3833 domain-containing protein [Rhodocista pekingensis]|uniref:DUF3833 domain-containing protein n=1 Tax=Rhodocista pekingensis TaxID=201185 RepID=A0ABW2KWU6_9PROT
MLRRLLLLAATVAALAGCSNMKPEQFAGTEPALHLEEFFQGRSRAYGLVEDRFGNVRRQFVVDIEGRWDGKVLTLTEDFVWNDGETERRVWELTKLDEHTWEGRTADAIGVATGRLFGQAYNMNYDFNLKMGERRMKVHFDDWMFLQPDGVLLNRATMSKFGIDLATITIAFRKEGAAAALPQPAPAERAAE